MARKKKVGLDDLKIDFTSMIDCTFLLIIFFLLMPMRELEGQLESYLPQEGRSDPTNEPPKTTFTLIMKSSKLNDQELTTNVLFAGMSMGQFTTFTPEYLDHLYSLPMDQMRGKIMAEEKRDKEQFDPGQSKVLKGLLDSMDKATKNAEEARNTDILVDASSDVPFKVVLAVINAAAGEKFTKLKFVAPDGNIWETGR